MTPTADAYRYANVRTASGRTVVLRAYEVAIRSLEEAEGALARGQSATEPMSKAQQIVAGLMSALDFSAGEIANRLLSLYVFVSERIQETRLNGRDAGLGAARRVLETVLEGWREVPPDVLRPDGRPPGEAVGIHRLG